MTHNRTLPILWTLRKHNCCWCGCELILPERPKNKSRLKSNSATVEHLLLRHRGGKSSIEYYSGHQGDLCNVKLACNKCNNLRQVANECIGAMHCAYAVVGKNRKGKAIIWLNQLPKE